MKVIDSCTICSTPAVSAASTTALDPWVRMRSFSAQAEARQARFVGGIAVARCSTTSCPANAPANWSGSKIDTRAGVAPAWSSAFALSSVLATAVTSWPWATNSGTTNLPTAPVAPVTNSFMLPPSSHGVLEPGRRLPNRNFTHRFRQGRDDVRNRLTGQLFAPRRLRTIHGDGDRATRRVVPGRHGSWTASADLAASEGRLITLDRLNDVEQRDVARIAGQSIATRAAGDRLDDAGLRH